MWIHPFLENRRPRSSATLPYAMTAYAGITTNGMVGKIGSSLSLHAI